MQQEPPRDTLARLTGHVAVEAIASALATLAVASIIGAVVLAFSLHATWDAETLSRAGALAVIAVVFFVWSILLKTKGGAS